MKQLSFDRRHGTLKLQVESLDDLWYLSQIIEPGDGVSGMTERKVRVGDAEKQVRKKFYLTVRAEKVEFQDYSNVLRVSGPVSEQNEDVPIGAHHAIEVEEGTVIKVWKPEWLTFHLKRLGEATAYKTASILICAHDRESAVFALLKRQGYEMLAELHGEVAKKGDETRSSTFYRDVIAKMGEYVVRYSVDRVILASPAFWKEDLVKEMKDETLAERIVPASCSSVGKEAIEEILKRPELGEVLRQDRIAREARMVEELLAEVGRKGLVSYGLEGVEGAAQAGAVKAVLVADSLVHKSRAEGYYSRIDDILKAVDAASGDIFIISGKTDAGKKLSGLGGIGAMLRYKLSY